MAYAIAKRVFAGLEMELVVSRVKVRTCATGSPFPHQSRIGRSLLPEPPVELRPVVRRSIKIETVARLHRESLAAQTRSG